MKLRRRQVLSAAAATAGAAAFGAPAIAQQQTLTVFFTRGFYAAEDAALDVAVQRFERATGIKVDLSRYAVQDIIPKTVAALEAGQPPDVAFGHSFDFQATGRWAFDGRLADISDVITPIAGRFLDNTISTCNLWNEKDKRRAYYAFPMQQQTIHIHYWADMMAEAGISESDIPKTWAAFWDFWGTRVQAAHRQRTGKRTFGIGQPMGVDSTDAFFSFLTFMDAYGVSLVDNEGRLTVDDPKVRDGLIKAMADYTGPYTKGHTPPSANTWKDPDNNVAFHNKTTVMTHNATISIAAKWLDDSNSANLTAEQRAEAKRNYEQNIKTITFPSKPDGSGFTYRAAVKNGVIFNETKQLARAKDFVRFMLEEENLSPFVEGALGRWFPVTKAGAASPFWAADVHRRAVRDQFAAGTVPFEFTKNWRFTVINAENVYARAMNRVVAERWATDRAVDEMIARIKQLGT
jgi:multiple sugar transport system substrate-binding protein